MVVGITKYRFLIREAVSRICSWTRSAVARTGAVVMGFSGQCSQLTGHSGLSPKLLDAGAGGKPRHRSVTVRRRREVRTQPGRPARGG